MFGILIGWGVARIRQSSSSACSPFGDDAQFDCAFMVLSAPQWKVLNSCSMEALLDLKRAPSTIADIEKTLSGESVVLLHERLKAAAEGLDVQETFILKTTNHAFMECQPSRAVTDSGVQVLLLVHDVTQRQRQQLMLQSENEAMKEEVRRYSAIMSTLEPLIWVRGGDNQIQYCNLAYARAVEELSGEVREIGVPELNRGMMKVAESARQYGEARERMHIVIEGKRRLLLVRETYLSELDMSIGFAEDISALERAEDEIKDYLSAQEALLESSTSAVAIFGGDTRLKFYNQAYVRMWGHDESWLDTYPTFGEILEFLREKRRLPEQANFQIYKKQHLQLFNEPEPKEELHFIPDGRTIRSVSIPDAQGGIILSYEDVTDRLALERSYNTLIAVQRETLDNLHEGVIVFGEDGRVRLSNPVYRKLWHLSEDDVTEQTHMNEILDKVKSLLAEDDWEGYKRTLNERIHSRSLYSLHRERKDGIVLDWSIVPLPDGGTLLTYQDVTAATLVERSLREKNEALQAADRLKTEFLANVSYELRSPLTSINGFSEMLRQNYFGELNDRQRDYVEGIHDSAQHLSGLINDILDLAGIEAGYLTLDISEFDIRDMLEAMLPLLSERIKHNHLHVQFDCPDDAGSMRGDETRLKQVLFHLLSNAIKYSHEEGNITLGARREKDYIRLWVKDEGLGIAPHEQEAIFEKFYRGAAGSNKSGTGLGLSMVKNFIELHGGKVELDSELGKGTTVACLIPHEPPLTLEEKEALATEEEDAVIHE